MTALRRTVPFLAPGRARDESRVLLLDRAELPLAAVTPELAARLARPVNLGPADRCLPAAQVERIVEGQYEACLEYIYGHPAWQRFRDGAGQAALYSYLLESRHYLAAAPFRMASGITDALRPSTLVRLQAHHVVEEADHDTYFENGLAALGAPRELVRQARPSPVTVEWIHLMRTVAGYSPLAAAICSGLLEYTAGDNAAVSGWHELLVERGLLGREAVQAIFEHVETDLGLGHGSNWRHAIQAARVVPVEELADWLNATSLVAEMIVRWLDSLDAGLSGEVVAALPGLVPAGGEPERVLSGEIDGLPVWPAEVYDSFAHGARSSAPGVRRALALAYAFAGRVDSADAQGSATAGDSGGVSGAGTGGAGAAAGQPAAATPGAPTTPVRAARGLVDRCARPWSGTDATGDLDKLVEGWMAAIDGHELWRELAERPAYPLVYGWMVENYHYVAGIWQHCGAAVSTCPDPVIRAELVKHLIEEFNHGKMFLRGIERGRGERYAGLGVAASRPLPTTVAFIGTLRELGQRDWKAYLLALGFLQLSLSAGGQGLHERHEGFYESMFRRLPEARELVAAMRRHDQEDTKLGHGDDSRLLLRLLGQRHPVGQETVAAAAVVPQLAWSFLDGIRRHYRHGDAAVLQRLGWHVEG
jgi:pyrroloquinoline quinone (PQQ) biosynthesis protein C